MSKNTNSKKPINRQTQLSLDNLEKTLSTFHPYVEEWLSSPVLGLSDTEQSIIAAYRRRKTHQWYVERSGRAMRTISVIFMKAHQKLRLAKTKMHFEKWLVYKKLCENGLGDGRADLKSLVQPACNIIIHADVFLKLYASLQEKIPIKLSNKDLNTIRVLNKVSSTDKKWLVTEGLRLDLIVVGDMLNLQLMRSLFQVNVDGKSR